MRIKYECEQKSAML